MKTSSSCARDYPTQVRLGVNAPDCAVYRKEIFTAIQEENIKARQTVQVELIKTDVKELFAGDDESKILFHKS